jgi:hypothetical protein
LLENAPSLAEVVEESPKRIIAAWIIGGLFFLATLGVYLFVARKHKNFDREGISLRSEDAQVVDQKRLEKLRKLHLKLLLFLPVFSLTSYLSLYFMKAAPIFETIRTFYESFILFLFYRLMVVTLGGHSKAHELLDGRLLTKWTCCGSNSRLTLVKWGILQLSIVHPVLDVLSLILLVNGLYDAGVMDFHQSYPYLQIVNVVSTIVAVVFLLQMYKACKTLLVGYNLGLKFLGIKLVIIVNIIQSLVLSALVRGDVIQSDSLFTFETKAEAWQNFLLVLEMLGISVLFLKAFPTSDYLLQPSLSAPNSPSSKEEDKE